MDWFSDPEGLVLAYVISITNCEQEEEPEAGVSNSLSPSSPPPQRVDCDEMQGTGDSLDP